MHRFMLLKHMLLNLLTRVLGRRQERENNNPQVFVPGNGARQRPSKKKSIDGSFVTKNKGKKGKKKHRNIHAGL